MTSNEAFRFYWFTREKDETYFFLYFTAFIFLMIDDEFVIKFVTQSTDDTNPNDLDTSNKYYTINLIISYYLNVTDFTTLKGKLSKVLDESNCSSKAPKTQITDCTNNRLHHNYIITFSFDSIIRLLLFLIQSFPVSKNRLYIILP